jgi:hypothetical protein
VVSLFSLTEIWPKNEIKNENFKKLHDFGGFSIASCEEKYIYSKISILGFEVCSKKYRRMTKDLFFTFG